VLRLTHVVAPHDDPYGTLVLTYAERQREGFDAQLKSGEAVEVMLPRGARLTDEAFLRSEDGKVVRVVAASEAVLHAAFPTPIALARATYVLGARHVPAQVEDGWLLVLPDAGVRHQLERLGAQVSEELRPFVPERGF
jgi:urease accessory protein